VSSNEVECQSPRNEEEEEFMATGYAEPAPPTIDAPRVDAFRAQLRGDLLAPGDPGYDDARRVWNAMFDKRPALIARCTGADDVAAAVRFAREWGVPLSVKGGGHGVAGKAICDDGLVIDLSPMKAVDVDPARRTGRAEGGVTWGEFDAATQAHGLATTGGVIPSTGIAGLTLGGGFGFLMRRFGLACDNLLSADVVLADGRLVTASAGRHPDLYWGLRGGGGNFGVVTSFAFRLHPVGPTVLGGSVVYPFAQAREVCRFFRGFTASAPEELGTYLGFATFPDGQPVVALVAGYTGPLDEGERVLGPLRGFGQPVADTVGPLPYTELQGLFAAAYPPGRQNYWKGNYLADLSDAAIGVLVDRFAEVPSPFAAIGLEHLGGAVARVASGATAFSERSAPYSLLITPAWEDAAESERNVRWARDFWNAIQPHAKENVYVNYVGFGEEERVKAAYGTNYARLAAVKETYDPTNLFRANHNVAPAG
jgi:FAD/FMN-containing dehydrogenase